MDSNNILKTLIYWLIIVEYELWYVTLGLWLWLTLNLFIFEFKAWELLLFLFRGMTEQIFIDEIRGLFSVVKIIILNENLWYYVISWSFVTS